MKEYYKILGGDSEFVDKFYSQEVIDKVKKNYEKISKYISKNKKNMSHIDLNGRFGHGKIVVNDFIPEKELEFVDGYARFVTGFFNVGRESQTEKCYVYNYIDENGKILFDAYGSQNNISIYVGRSIFLNIDSSGYCTLRSPNNEDINMGKILDVISKMDIEKFIDFVVTELNRKYSMEENDVEYEPTKKTKEDWMIKSFVGMDLDIREQVLKFVEVISTYDNMPRDMYLGDKPLAQVQMKSQHSGRKKV